MEKVRIFSQGTKDEYKELEEEVNQWLAENEGVEIISRYVTGAAGEDFVNCTIVIFYRPKA